MTIHIGRENYVNRDEIYAIARYKGDTMKKLRSVATNDGRYFTFAGPEPVRSLVLMKNGMVFGSCVTAKTLAGRMDLTSDADHFIARSEVGRYAESGEEDGENDEFYLDETYAEESEEEEGEE